MSSVFYRLEARKEITNPCPQK